VSRRHLVVSAAGWVGFVAVSLWAMAFLTDVVLPRTVDHPHRLPTAQAAAVDLALLLLFAVQHSVMARGRVKAWLRRWVPAPLERATYVLAADACLALLFLLWQPFGGQLWHVDGAAARLLWLPFVAGWVLAVASTFAVDHLELLGLRQAGWAPGRPPDTTLHVGGLHALVRHPLMSGLVLAFWATPRMGASHLLFAVAATGYVAVGIRFEERDLRRTFGAAYDEYAARVPAVVPGLGGRRRRVGAGQDA
jgi:protein-S-isoprenylcysteine O-methyltransferase Ste14